jgi:hypothetical protein
MTLFLSNQPQRSIFSEQVNKKFFDLSADSWERFVGRVRSFAFNYFFAQFCWQNLSHTHGTRHARTFSVKFAQDTHLTASLSQIWILHRTNQFSDHRHGFDHSLLNEMEIRCSKLCWCNFASCFSVTPILTAFIHSPILISANTFHYCETSDQLILPIFGPELILPIFEPEPTFLRFARFLCTTHGCANPDQMHKHGRVRVDVLNMGEWYF